MIFKSGISQSFVDIASDLGIEHTHTNGILMGGGVVFFDFDNDGFDDLFLTGGSQPDRLYKNYFGERFGVVWTSKGYNYHSMGAVAGDLNNDGWIDLVITTYKGSAIVILENDGNGQFNVLNQSEAFSDKYWNVSATLMDVNDDNLLDIYVTNYIDKNSINFDDNGVFQSYNHECYPNLLYVNKGNFNFVEMANEYGVADVGCGLAVTSGNFGRDNKLNLYNINDFGEWIVGNRFYEIDNSMTQFENISTGNGLDSKVYGMGVAVADINNDGYADFYVSNIGSNPMLISDDVGNYTNRSPELGIESATTIDGKNSTSWGTFFFDYNNDSQLDLFVANGYISAVSYLNTDLNDANKIYQGNSDGTFIDVSENLGIASTAFSRGAAYSDFDNDGDLDFVVSNVYLNVEEAGDEHKVAFYRNNSDNGNTWVGINLEKSITGSSALGSKVLVYLNGKVQSSYVLSGSSFASQNSSTIHFGLNLSSIIDTLEIRWNGGQVDKFYDLDVNTRYRVNEGGGLYKEGCLDEDALNFDNTVDLNLGCKYTLVQGCTDPSAYNYNPNANYGDDTCISYAEVVSGTSLKDDGYCDIEIYPVPAQDLLNIRYLYVGADYQIVDFMGTLLVKGIAEMSGLVSIDISPLKRGIYFLNITNNGKKCANLKFIKS